MLSKSKRPEERNWAEMQDALDMGHPTSPGSLDDQDPLLFGDVDPSHRKSPSPVSPLTAVLPNTDGGSGGCSYLHTLS